MFYGINKQLVDLADLEIEHVLAPMQQLNRWSLEGRLEMTAFSFATYAQASRHYRALGSGWSLGYATGPQIVARPQTALADLQHSPMASPGHLTTAHWLARLWNPRQEFVEVDFQQTLNSVLEGQTLSALVIHEGMMQLQESGLVLVQDLGHWWGQQTGGLPIPLGLNGVRRDLDGQTQRSLARALHDSISLALQNVDAALDQALPLARGLDRERCKAFVLRYVNASTLNPGSNGLKAVHEFYRRAQQAALIDEAPEFMPLNA